MRTGYAFLAALSLSLTQCASANFYLKDKWVGEDFFQGWTWETESDPTHGRIRRCFLTDEGERVAKACEAAAGEVEEMLLAGFDSTQRREFAELLALYIRER